MSEKTLNIELSIDETNLILDGLGQLPFVRVYGLIGKIQEQARNQLNGQDVTPAQPTNGPASPKVPGTTQNS